MFVTRLNLFILGDEVVWLLKFLVFLPNYGAWSQPLIIKCNLGTLYAQPDVKSKEVGPLDTKCDCGDSDLNNPANKNQKINLEDCSAELLYDQMKTTHEKIGRVLVLKDATFLGVKLKKGTVFTYLDSGCGAEGDVTISFPGHSSQCGPSYWGGGYNPSALEVRQATSGFKHLNAPGMQEWYRLLSPERKSLGWFLESQLLRGNVSFKKVVK